MLVSTAWDTSACPLCHGAPSTAGAEHPSPRAAAQTPWQGQGNERGTEQDPGGREGISARRGPVPHRGQEEDPAHSPPFYTSPLG